ncbi:MAG: ADP-ribosylation factor-like protein [Promethearchaeota archaeon]
MSIERKKIIKNFCRRFLEVKEEPKSFSEILNLSPKVLKGCSDEEAEVLSKHGYKRIRDLTKIKVDNIKKVAEKIGLKEIQLRKWTLAAGLINRAWQKRSKYLKKQEMKIAVLGLDNAGKTSMLNSLSGKTQMGQVEDTAPTVGVNIRKIDSDNFQMIIWDFGGQIGHRHDYLQNPEEYFMQLDLIFYVVDMQDNDRYDESLDYFRQIMDIITFLAEKPYVLILLHKCDPDIINNSDFQLNLDFMRGAFEEIMTDTDLTYEIIESSIYNLYKTEPEFATTVKRFFSANKTSSDINENLQHITETLMTLSATIINKFEELKNLIYRATGIMGGGQYPVSSVPARKTKKGAVATLRKSGVMPQGKSMAANSGLGTIMQGIKQGGGNGSGSIINGPNNAKPSAPSSPMANRAAMLSELKQVLKFRKILSD